jgi:hypothetical protein
MANTILTPTAVTREALRVLHQKLNFVGTITRDYDDSFAKKGAKIGDSLKIRLPNQYSVRTGATLSVNDTSETSTTLQIATQKGVDLNFSSNELTLSLDDFSDRILEPAMAVLAANIEADAMAMYKDVYQQVNNQGSAITLNKVLTGRKALNDALAPTANRTANLNTQDNLDLVDALKGLFQDSASIAKQYKEGMMGRTVGFDFYENTLWPKHTSGTENGSSSTLTVNGATQTGASVTIANGSSKTLKQGDIITFAGCNRVHPESKADTGALMQFVVTADVASSGTSVSISPAIVTSGATQNVSASPTNSGAVTKVGTASQQYGLSMAYHKEAFAFATADLVMPKGVDFGAREVMDGISMRIVRAYDINNDKFPCRLDVLYGYKTIRPQLAVRLANN